jgi:hypothetical protein
LRSHIWPSSSPECEKEGAKKTSGILTDRRIPIPEKTTFTGGNTFAIEFKHTNDEERCGTYEITTVTESWVGREGMQHIDDRPEPLEQFGIAVPKFIKRPGLFLEYVKNRIGGVTAIDPVGERVVAEIFPSLLGVVC